MDSSPNNGQVKNVTSCRSIKLQREVIYMGRKYTMMEHLAVSVKERKAAGETNHAIDERHEGLLSICIARLFLSGVSEII